MKKIKTLSLFIKMGWREFKAAWLQFVALFLISCTAVTLFVGLLSNAATFENQIQRAYEYGNCADLFLKVSRYQEEEEKEIQSLLSSKGTMDFRYQMLGVASGKNAYLLVHDGLPTIGIPYDVNYADGYEDATNFCFVDPSLLEGENGLGNLLLGGRLDFEIPLQTYLSVALNSLDFSSITNSWNELWEQYPLLSILFSEWGLSKEDVDELFESLSQENVNFEELFSLLDPYVKDGGENILKEDSLVLPFTITGSMKFSENVQMSAYQMTNILISDSYFKDQFQALIDTNFQENISPLLKIGFSLLLDANPLAFFREDQSFIHPNQYLFTFEDSAEIDNFSGELQSYFSQHPDNFVSLNKRSEMAFALTIENDAQQARQFTFVFPFVFFAVALLIVLTTTGQLLIRNRTQIGTFKAMGISKKEIYLYFLSFVLLVTFLGTLFGNILGPIIVPSILGFKYDLLYTLPSRILIFPWWEALLASFVFLLCSLAFTYFMARREIKLSPAESMRPKPPKLKTKKKNFSFLNKGKKGTYFLSLRMALRNIRVGWVRSFMLIVGVMGCTMLLVTGFGIEDTIHYGVDYDMSSFYDADFSGVLSRGEKKEQLISFVESIDGIKKCEPYLSMSLPVEKEGGISQELDVRVISLWKESTIHLPFKEDSLYISQKSAKELGVGIGDIVSFSFEGISFEAPVTDIYESFVFHGLILPDTHPSLKDKPLTYGNFWVYLEESLSEETMEIQIEESFQNNKQIAPLITLQSRSTYRQTIEDIMSSVYVMTNAVKVFAIILAVTSLYNLALLSFKERIRDIATLRVLGFSRREIASSLLFESLSLTSVGVLFGMLLGYPFLIAVLMANKVALVEYIYMIYPWTYLIAFLITFFLSFVINLLLALRTNKVPMVESLKSVE